LFGKHLCWFFLDKFQNSIKRNDPLNFSSATANNGQYIQIVTKALKSDFKRLIPVKIFKLFGCERID